MMHGDGDRSKILLGEWIAFVQLHARAVIAVSLLLTAGILYFSLTHFRINTDVNGMISEKLRFRKLENDFSRAFPQLSDTIVVVIQAETPELATNARVRLARGLREEKTLFKDVYEPGGGVFFEKNGLLYLSEEELEDFADKITAAQPLIGFLSEDLSLRGLFSVLGQALEQPKDTVLKEGRLSLFFEEMRRAFDSAATHRLHRVSWQRLMLGDRDASSQMRQFVMARPYLDVSSLSAGEVALDRVRKMAKDLSLDGEGGVKVRVTGDVALASENLAEVRSSVGVATLLSLLLVGFIIYIGLGGYGRMMVAALTTLIIGLVWTTGFAIAFIGSLNMISVTFAVLFIGLGIDYSIQFCLRHKELLESGVSHRESLATTSTGVGRSLLLSCITTAIGFYAFVPTAYAGVAELGMISGTGMFISFVANLTILPALIELLPVKAKKVSNADAVMTIVKVPYRYPRLIVAISLLLGIASALLLPRFYFDYNPLNLYDQKSESVAAIKELFRDPETTPWTISVVVRGKEYAGRLAEKLRALGEVKTVVTLFDFVPEKQTEKLSILSDMRLFMPPGLGHATIKKLSYQQDLRALDVFENKVRDATATSSEKERAMFRGLYKSIQEFKLLLKDPVRGKTALDGLEESLLGNLPSLFRRLDMSFQASPVDMHTLPKDLAAQYLSSDGRYRVQVFPRENIMDRAALARFVKSVQAVAPEATDAPVSIYESGMAIISSFKEATLYAFVAITIFLLVELRKVLVTVMILTPLILVTLTTGAASVLLGIPLNFANVIVVPLLLGIGVHSGIIFVVRYQSERPQGGNMLTTSNARAALFSNLATMVSTGSLSFSSHRGIASIGILLTLCLGFLIVSTLVLLPALLKLVENRLKHEDFV
jgi:hopanoid biosynthesis associated RND transporter like protein HpnN